MHGHQVGGTNPSLVEALGAGNPVIGHDNCFNRWVAGDAGLYFADVDGCDTHITQILAEPTVRDAKAAAALQRWSEAFSWPTILEAYREVIGGPTDAPRSADA
jgi:glycosyltransferase involved in cell wall biosynthesis